jgi:hypothetical protein
VSEIVYRPDEPHRCRVVPDMRRRSFNVDGKITWLDMAVYDPPSTVRRCECGRTMVAYHLPPQAGYAAGYNVRWRPEGRIARWWRVRRAIRRAAKQRERSEPQ